MDDLDRDLEELEKHFPTPEKTIKEMQLEDRLTDLQCMYLELEQERNELREHLLHVMETLIATQDLSMYAKVILKKLEGDKNE